MLVISRKKNESIVLNNDVTLTVVEIRGDKVRLGVVAPRNAPSTAKRSTTPSAERCRQRSHPGRRRKYPFCKRFRRTRTMRASAWFLRTGWRSWGAKGDLDLGVIEGLARQNN
jgi:carbon storage regulator